MVDKRIKKYGVIIGILLFLGVVMGFTYAALAWRSSNIIISGNTECFDVDYTKGSIGSNDLLLIDEKDVYGNGNDNVTIVEGMSISYTTAGIKSNCSLDGYLNIRLNVNSLASGFTSSGSSTGALKFIVASYDTSNYSSIESSLVVGDAFPIISSGIITHTGSIDLYTKQLPKGTTNGYLIIVYIDGDLALNDVAGDNASLDANISAVVTQGTLDIDADYTLKLLNSLNSTIAVDTANTPDFTKISGTSGDGTKGLYAAEDDYGKTYYFRGAVENNYVKFGKYSDNLYYGNDSSSNTVVGSSCDNIPNDCVKLASAGDDMYWRIVRINGNGSIRLVYAGTSPSANGASVDTHIIGTSKFNDYKYDNGYVGYRYGNFTTPSCTEGDDGSVSCSSGGSTSYDTAHANTKDSTIKKMLEKWMSDNFSSFSYIDDAIFCDDRSITKVSSLAGLAFTGDGYGIQNTAYSTVSRNWIDYVPSLKCTNSSDRFTAGDSAGNSKLGYPIGLLTSDEIIMAGAKTYGLDTGTYTQNKDFYLYTNSTFWAMTPFGVANGVAQITRYNMGFVDIDSSTGEWGVRPVISIKYNALTTGSGTMSDPFSV